jgi:PHD-finger
MAANRKKPQSTRLNLKDGEDDGEEFVICGACRKRDSPDKKGDNNWIECDSCMDWFHHVCVKFVFRTAITKANGPDAEFKCTECRRSNTAVNELSVKLSEKIDKMGRDMDAFKTHTANELAAIKAKATEIHTMADDNRMDIDELLKHGDPAMSQRVVSVEEDIQRRDCLLIVSLSNLPVIQSMNDISIIVKIGSILQLNTRRNDIVRCWRTKVADNRRIPRLFCRFVDLRARNDFFFAWMARKDITLDLIAPNQPKTKIYIDAMLSSSAFHIKQKAKSMMKDGKLASVYTLDGYVLVKRAGDTSGRRMLTPEDLDHFVNSSQNGPRRGGGGPAPQQHDRQDRTIQGTAGASVSGAHQRQSSRQNTAPQPAQD